MKPFNFENTPLAGVNLIEASAGTGKTYTIEALFVRLILEKRLAPDQILVVTFTNAATEELRDRIHGKLRLAQAAFAGGGSVDSLLDTLVKKSGDPATDLQLVQAALVNFDRAAIFTIHGFCQRILLENAFETGSLFDTEVAAEQDDLLREIAEDFWRKTFYRAPLEVVGYFTGKLKGPEDFMRLLTRVRASDFKIIPESRPVKLASLEPLRQAIKNLKAAWPLSRSEVLAALKNPGLKAGTYGSLKPAAADPQKTKRDLKVAVLAEAMDRLTDPASPGFPLFEGFEKFSTAKLRQASRKNQVPPTHAFFKLCDAVQAAAVTLEAELERFFLDLKIRLFQFARTELRKRKAERNIYFFDDLLVLVRRALEGPAGEQLAGAVRRKYRAALVDEFQDTDRVQYEIFKRLFALPDSLLFMIGDPKQAIYSFRGADIFSYLQAARFTDSKYTLTRNWRSHAPLVTAVNTIFSNAPAPFVFDEIGFEPAQPAVQAATTAAEPDSGCTIWYLDASKYSRRDKPLPKSEAVDLIAQAVAQEIYRMTSSAPEPTPAGEIAVLVRTNRQAQIIKRCLSARGILSVLHSTGNIFDSREAMEIARVLKSISQPADMARLKAALTTDMMGVKGEQLAAVDNDPLGWENRLAEARSDLQLWHRHGFIRMFQRLLAREKVRQRLLSFPDGERRLTNIRHLAEILQQATLQQNLGVSGLLKWLDTQREPNAPRLQEHQLRLESDEDAVKIVTIHKSKGLEYPIVFCPYGWEGVPGRESEITFHDGAGDMQLILDLTGGRDARHLARARNELLAENLRLLYVALTRAKRKCYLAWGRISTAGTSAIAYLLHKPDGNENGSVGNGDLTATLKQSFDAKTDADLFDEIKQLADRSEGSIQLAPLPVPSRDRLHPARPDGAALTCREFFGKIDRTWKISSYSSLISRQPADIDMPDHDAGQFPTPLPEEDLSADADRPQEQAADIFAFPRGARAGIFFHDIFEHLDFTKKTSKYLRELAARKLEQFGFEKSWQTAVCDMLRRVVARALPAGEDSFCLSSVGGESRINEMEFYFPLKPITPSKLSAVFETHGQTGMPREFPDQMQKLEFAPTAGFMKGYVDMVFKHNGRFYLVDWKSNYLGPDRRHYDQKSLNQTMAENFYVLQYHLYVLALYQYLRLRQPDFDYASDFGGVFYIFIRGVGDDAQSDTGVYADFPEADFIQALGQALIPGF